MKVSALKAYLKALKFGGSNVDNTQQELVDAACEAAWGKVWKAHVWTVSRKQKDDLTTTAAQPYTTLPKDFSGIKTCVLIDGNRSRKINIVGEDNFESDHPYPQAWSTKMPLRAKLVYHSPQQNEWRLYWARVPDGAYTMRLVYRRVEDLSFFENVPSHMIEPVMLAAATLILPPGPTQNNQMQAAIASLSQAIESDNSFIGAPEMVGAESGFNDWDVSTRMHVADEDNPFGL